MKLSLKQLALFLGGGAAVLTGKAATETAHADMVTVKKGDTTWDIAQEYNKKHEDAKTSVDQIVKDNKLKDGGKLILIDQKLEVNKDDGQPKNVSQNTSSNSQTVATSTSTQQTSSVQGQSHAVAPSTSVSTPQHYQAQTTQSSSSYTSNLSGGESAAKEWIAARESGGSYTAQNGRYYGRYQLDSSYLGGDYSAAHQEQVANNYVKGRYGSWQAAQAFWQSHGWY